MSPLTATQQAELDTMAAAATHSVTEAVGVAQQAGHLADQLRKHGINASVSATLTPAWAHIWVTVRPTSREKLSDALTRLDLVEDETRHRAHPYGWHDIYLQGIDVPLFVLLDETAEKVPA
jgi:uncharacterized protein with von Willebrand factor type A (vWA) domain